MNILTIVGARPQFVKAAVLSRRINDHQGITEKLVHTGQHYDHNMSKIFFEEMEISHPHFQLEVSSGSNAVVTDQMVQKIKPIILQEKPDFVLVYGDTNTTLAGAMAASQADVPVIHVEAGLRSYNENMPEEINRVLVDRISAKLFAPTLQAVNNLHNEGFSDMKKQVFLSGDIMQDAALFYEKKASEKSTIIKDLKLVSGSYVLATIHRAENTDLKEKLSALVEILNSINETLPVIIPIHPRTQKMIKEFGLSPQFKQISPVGYFDMIALIKNARFIMTDSGGLQKEAYFFNKYCITLRNETEWTELVSNGVSFLCGSEIAKVEQAISTIDKASSVFTEDLYGGGNAAEKIIEGIMKA